MTTDPLGFAQNAFESAYVEVGKSREPIRRSSIARQTMAYGLKAVAVFGGLAISSGLVSAYAQYIGLAIAAAVAADGLFLNHVRMLLVTKASQAYKRLANDARRAHTLRLGPILEIKEAQPDNFRQQFLQLHNELTGKMHTGCAEVELALDEGHIKALDTLTLDSERSKPTLP